MKIAKSDEHIQFERDNFLATGRVLFIYTNSVCVELDEVSAERLGVLRTVVNHKRYTKAPELTPELYTYLVNEGWHDNRVRNYFKLSYGQLTKFKQANDLRNTNRAGKVTLPRTKKEMYG